MNECDKMEADLRAALIQGEIYGKIQSLLG